MRTKLLLIIVFLFINQSTSSVNIRRISHAISAQATATLAAPSQVQDNLAFNDIVVPESPDAGHKHAEKAPKQSEDGKHHHFHFSRIPGRKRRNLWVIASKVVLTIAHICLFVYCFMHVFH